MEKSRNTTCLNFVIVFHMRPHNCRSLLITLRSQASMQQLNGNVHIFTFNWVTMADSGEHRPHFMVSKEYITVHGRSLRGWLQRPKLYGEEDWIYGDSHHWVGKCSRQPLRKFPQCARTILTLQHWIKLKNIYIFFRSFFPEPFRMFIYFFFLCRIIFNSRMSGLSKVFFKVVWAAVFWSAAPLLHSDWKGMKNVAGLYDPLIAALIWRRGRRLPRCQPPSASKARRSAGP